MRLHFLGIVAVSLALGGFFVTASSAAAQQTERFYVQKEYDGNNRSDLDAFELVEGTHARLYIEEDYWDELSSSEQADMEENFEELSSLFDTQIYPRVTGAYGLPWTPGIDNDPKITFLFSEMENGVGGAFRFDDEESRVEEERSNEREMVYLNVIYADHYVIREFMAHEFVHLIHYNQKRRPHGVREETWLGELLAEAGPGIAGLHANRYDGTNFENRVRAFQQSPGSSLTEWGNSSSDYASVALFGNYISNHYGVEVLAEALRSPVAGIAALEDGFAKANAGVTARQAFLDWVVTNALNDCAVGTGRTYCYDDPNLPYSELHIRFQRSGQNVDDGASFDATLAPWSAQWLRAEHDEEKETGVLVYEAEITPGHALTMPYVVFEYDGDVAVRQLNISNGEVTLAVEGFGETVEAVLIVPVNMLERDIEVSSNLFVAEEVPAGAQTYDGAQLVDAGGAVLVDGDLIREAGTHDVYIVKLIDGQRYKRLILNPDIFNSYGHLSWERVRTVSASVMDSFADSQFVIEVYPDGTPVSGEVFQLVGAANSDTGVKRRVVGGYDLRSVYHINHLEAADTFYPLVP